MNLQVYNIRHNHERRNAFPLRLAVRQEYLSQLLFNTVLYCKYINNSRGRKKNLKIKKKKTRKKSSFTSGRTAYVEYLKESNTKTSK